MFKTETKFENDDKTGFDVAALIIAILSLVVSGVAFVATRQTDIHAVQGHFSFDPSSKRNGLWLENAGDVAAWVKVYHSPRTPESRLKFVQFTRTLSKELYPNTAFYYAHDTQPIALGGKQKVPVFTYNSDSPEASKTAFKNFLSELSVYVCACDLALRRCSRAIVRSKPRYSDLKIFEECNSTIFKDSK